MILNTKDILELGLNTLLKIGGKHRILIIIIINTLKIQISEVK